MILRALLLLSLLSFTACAHVPAADVGDVRENPSYTVQKNTPLQTAARHDAQKIIDAYWAISQKDRDSGMITQMREGALNTALCMEEHITILKDIENLRFAYSGFYWNLYNGMDACFSDTRGIMCGTENHTVHNLVYAKLLEEILYDIYKQINRYK